MRAMRHVWLLDKAEAALGLPLLEQALEIDKDYHWHWRWPPGAGHSNLVL